MLFQLSLSKIFTIPTDVSSRDIADCRNGVASEVMGIATPAVEAVSSARVRSFFKLWIEPFNGSCPNGLGIT
jgi:hypothetical protein